MTNFSVNLTITEARAVLKSKSSFLATEHNRKMIAAATHEILVKIQNKK